MQASLFLAIAILVGLATGGLLGAQPSVNGHLSRNLEHPLQAALISFLCGTGVILAVTLISGTFPPKFVTAPLTQPWWVWIGGAIGVVVVSTSLFFVPRIGSLPWFAALMTGQTIASIILDHYGLLGNQRAPISSLRMIGAAMLIMGVLAIVQAKRNEFQPPLPHDSTSESTETFSGQAD